MTEYIGGKPRKKGKGLKQFLFLVLVVSVGGGIYVYYNYVWPKRVLNETFSKIVKTEKMINLGCKKDDLTCKQRLSRAVEGANNHVFAEKVDMVTNTPELKKHLQKAHIDKSICFLAPGKDGENPKDDKLNAWLEEYGIDRFLDDKKLIASARSMYEEKYHKPTPVIAECDLMRKLRWRHIPFGQTWRDYTLASRFLEWSALAHSVTRSTETTPEQKRMMKAMKKNPAYFTDQNIDRLTGLAKRKLTLKRMEKIRTAIRRFNRDVRELPLNEDRTGIMLGWLASKDDMHPWLKRRWHGPYVDETELVDLWECPIIGQRVPKTGAMTLISMGSDCKEYGKALGEDIEIEVNAYVAPTPEEEKPEVAEKKIFLRKKNRRNILLP